MIFIDGKEWEDTMETRFDDLSFDDIVKLAEMKKEKKKTLDREILNRIREKFKKYIDTCFEDPKKYGEEFADAIRKHDAIKMMLLSSLRILRIETDPKDYFSLKKIMLEAANKGRENIEKVLSIIYYHQWDTDDKWNNKLIFHEDFKEICSIPILVPFWFTPISGEYLVYILHRNKCRFYHNENDSSMYMRFYKSYVIDIEKYLSVSLEGIFIPKGSGYGEDGWISVLKKRDDSPNEYLDDQSYQMYREGTLGEKLLKEFDFVSYAFRKRKYNFLSMFEDSKTHDHLPYVDSSINAIMHGNLAIHPEHKERFLLKTLLLQELDKTEMNLIDDTVFVLNMSIFSIYLVVECARKYVECLVTAKRTASTPEAFHYYDENLLIYKHKIENWLVSFEKGFNSLEKDHKFTKIYATSRDLYKNILWKFYIQEIEATITCIDQAYQIPFQTHERVDAVLDYLRLQPDECIGVKTWTDFKKKYESQIKDFFPSLSDEALQQIWLQTINLLLCLFPAKYSISLNQDDLPSPRNPISQSWLDRMRIDVGSIKARELFSFMHLVFFSSEWPVATKGTNTSFYYAPRKEDDASHSRDKSLSVILKNIKTHFTSKLSPHYSDVLIFQASLWEMEQHYGFFMTKEWADIFRRSFRVLLELFKYHVLYVDSIDSCRKVAWRYLTQCEVFEKFFLNEQKKLSEIDPYLKKLFDVAGLPVAKIEKPDLKV